MKNIMIRITKLWLKSSSYFIFSSPFSASSAAFSRKGRFPLDELQFWFVSAGSSGSWFSDSAIRHQRQKGDPYATRKPRTVSLIHLFNKINLLFSGREQLQKLMGDYLNSSRPKSPFLSAKSRQKCRALSRSFAGFSGSYASNEEQIKPASVFLDLEY